MIVNQITFVFLSAGPTKYELWWRHLKFWDIIVGMLHYFWRYKYGIIHKILKKKQ